MTNRERVENAIAGRPVDRFPVFPILIAPACKLMGVSQRDYFRDPSIMAETLLKARELCGFDGIYVSRDNWVYHEALGGKLFYPEDDETFSKGTLLGSVAEYDKLVVPDPREARSMRTVLEAAERVMSEAGDTFYIQANIDTGPFSLACVLRGAQGFIMDLYNEDEALTAAFLEFCTDTVIAYGKEMIATGVHGIQMGEATASLLSPDLFRKFVLPYLNRAAEELAGQGADIWLHICGSTRHISADIATLSIQGFEVDALVPLGEARNLLGPKIALKGNIDTSFLLQASPEGVYLKTREILADYGLPSGLIFSPGCGVPKMTTLENLKAMVRACEDFEPRNVKK
jgi:MtaA/CmuA family methyltransferase